MTQGGKLAGTAVSTQVWPTGVTTPAPPGKEETQTLRGGGVSAQWGWCNLPSGSEPHCPHPWPGAMHPLTPPHFNPREEAQGLGSQGGWGG